MKPYSKALLVGTLLAFTYHPDLMADKVNMDAIHTMEIKLANLEVDISSKQMELMKREVELNELKVKSLSSNKVDRKKMEIKLAEIEANLAKDKLLLSERQEKFYEMKYALAKDKL